MSLGWGWGGWGLVGWGGAGWGGWEWWEWGDAMGGWVVVVVGVLLEHSNVDVIMLEMFKQCSNNYTRSTQQSICFH